MHDEMFTKRIYLIAQHDWLSPCVVQHVRVLPCEGDQSVWANSERWARPRLLCRSIFGLDDNDQCKSVDGIMVLMVIIMVVVMVKMVAAINFASRICSSLSVTLVPLWKGWWFLIKNYNERVIESGNKYISWYIIYLMAISTKYIWWRWCRCRQWLVGWVRDSSSRCSQPAERSKSRWWNPRSI